VAPGTKHMAFHLRLCKGDVDSRDFREIVQLVISKSSFSAYGDT
jgi:hypothetical protein